MPKPKPTWKDAPETKALRRFLTRRECLYLTKADEAFVSLSIRRQWSSRAAAFTATIDELDRLSTRPTRARKHGKR